MSYTLLFQIFCDALCLALVWPIKQFCLLVEKLFMLLVFEPLTLVALFIVIAFIAGMIFFFYTLFTFLLRNLKALLKYLSKNLYKLLVILINSIKELLKRLVLEPIRRKLEELLKLLEEFLEQLKKPGLGENKFNSYFIFTLALIAILMFLIDDIHLRVAQDFLFIFFEGSLSSFLPSTG